MPRPRTKSHLLLENAACLDVTDLLRAGWLAPGWQVSGVLPVHYHPDRRPAGAVYLTCSALFEECASINVSFRAAGGPVGQEIRLVSISRVPFGGQRWFFLCPATGARACRLYLPRGGRLFLSREAHGLRYAVEHATTEDTDIERVFRLHYRISGELPPLGALSPLPPRRKGMHQHRYERLTWEMMRVQGRVVGRAAAWLGRRECAR